MDWETMATLLAASWKVLSTNHSIVEEVYDWIANISLGVENNFIRLWGMSISDAIFQNYILRHCLLHKGLD